MMEIVVYDHKINAINRGKADNKANAILCEDIYGNDCKIDFEICAQNYLAEHPNSSGKCVGERNIVEKSFVFYTSGIKTKVVFKRRYTIRGIGNGYLFGGNREKRFLEFQRLFAETKYTTYDLS